MALHERWKDYTDKEIMTTKKTKCLKCPYKATILGSDLTNAYDLMCDYSGKTGHLRKCRPEDCTHYLDKNVDTKKIKFNSSI